MMSLFLFDLLFPAIVIIAGWAMWKHCPKRINALLGYRTTRSMKNMDTWKFAHDYCGRLWWKLGWSMLILSALIAIPFYRSDSATIGAVSSALLLVQCAALILSLFPAEAALKRTFNDDGTRKNRPMNRSIRVSAKALVIRNGCMLAIRVCDRDGTFFIMPGGGQRAGELLPNAAEREVSEETGISVRAKEAAFIIEGAQGEPHHRVDIVFLCDDLGETGRATHADQNQAGFEWLPIATLNTAPLYPSRLRRAIMNLHAGLPHPFYLGNESVGDPEIVD